MVISPPYLNKVGLTLLRLIKKTVLACLLFGIGLSCSMASALLIPNLSSAQLNQLALKIEQNETAGQKDYLTYWSKNEAFPSFGIGHFIWLPKNSQAPFQQTFPDLVQFISKTKSPPYWLLNLHPFELPWQNRTEFYRAFNDEALTRLRDWLAESKTEQAQFIVNQFVEKVAQKLTQLSPEQQRIFVQNLNLLMLTEPGVYAVLDYYNFKGLGANSQEQYQGQGWGLVDVVLNMDAKKMSAVHHTALAEFVDSAKEKLLTRTKNAPKTKNESRWLTGWFKRLNGYLTHD